jgi:hypothetical protein
MPNRYEIELDDDETISHEIMADEPNTAIRGLMVQELGRSVESANGRTVSSQPVAVRPLICTEPDEIVPIISLGLLLGLGLAGGD